MPRAASVHVSPARAANTYVGGGYSPRPGHAMYTCACVAVCTCMCEATPSAARPNAWSRIDTSWGIMRRRRCKAACWTPSLAATGVRSSYRGGGKPDSCDAAADACMASTGTAQHRIASQAVDIRGHITHAMRSKRCYGESDQRHARTDTINTKPAGE